MTEPLDDKQALAAFRSLLSQEQQERTFDFRREQDQRRENSRRQLAELAVTGQLEAMRLSHDLDVDIRDRDFFDLIRSENIRLQSLATELAIRLNHHKSRSKVDLGQKLTIILAELLKQIAILKAGKQGNITTEEILDILNNLEKS